MVEVAAERQTSAFLVTDSPAAVEPHHRVVMWLGKDHGPIPDRIVLHARTPNDFLDAAIEHVQPGMVENFDCALMGDPETTKTVADLLLERYRYASRQAHFDLNTMRWTYKICALQTLQKIYRLPNQIHTIKQLADAHSDDACLIIGAGPSLDISAIDPERILTIATSRSAILCFRAGWCPDYIIHIDPDPFDDGMREQLLAHPLARGARWIAAFQVHQKFVDLPGQTFWFGSRLNPASLWLAKESGGQPDVPLIVSGGSVSCCAFTIAEFMGCSPICLIGQDLSYQGGSKYSGGPAATRFSSVGVAEPDRVYLPKIGGGRVQTTMDYMSYADWFVRHGRQCRRKLINCTASGVFLPGFELSPLDDVYARYCRGRKPGRNINARAQYFNRPKIVPALERARAILGEVDRNIQAGRYDESLDLLNRMARKDADGFFLTGCTQYEAKILSYFAHRPPDHPQMKRCIEILAAASREACLLIEQAINGDVAIPPLTEDEVSQRMRQLQEINSLA